MDEVCCLVSKCLGIFLLFLLLIPLWSENTRSSDFNYLVFAEVCFMMVGMVYLVSVPRELGKSGYSAVIVWGAL